KFRERRPLALNAEVYHRLDQADAETLLPETMDGHARGERVRRIDEPLRQAQAVFGSLDWPGRQDGRDARLDLLAFLGVLAAHEQVGVARFVRFLSDHRRRDFLVDGLVLLAPSRDRVEEL